MSTYVIGDVQGCYDLLQRLIETIEFNETRDRLWFVGDLVNRGPKSLEVLRFVKQLGDQHQVVLGNHDIHLLSVAAGIRSQKASDTLHSVLAADDCEELLFWLRHQKLLYLDTQQNYLMVHAGILPSWSLDETVGYAEEIEAWLHGDHYVEFLTHMYDDQPNQWDSQLTGFDRYRFILNVFTRIRYLDAEGRLNLKEKGPLGTQPAGLHAWFDDVDTIALGTNIIFGHWASLKADTGRNDILSIDTGAIWGGALSAIRLEDQHRFSVSE